MHPLRIAHPEAKCPRHPDKDYRRLVQAAWAAGWWCVRQRKYIYCRPPDLNLKPIQIPMTPYKRTIHNVTGKFRRSGLEV
jgi:hypothetical protein